MMFERDNILLAKSTAFGDRIIKMKDCLKSRKVDHNIIDQISRCGTSIGANVCEAVYAESRADFSHKLKIALKEANETKYWLAILKTAKGINEKEHDSMKNDLMDIIYILVATLKSLKKNDEKYAK